MHYIADILACFGVVHHRSARHININVLAVCAVAFVSSAVSTMLGEHVSLEFKVQQRPIVVVSAQVDVAAAAAVAPIGTAVRVVFYVSEVHRTPSALTRAAVNLYVVYEV